MCFQGVYSILSTLSVATLKKLSAGFRKQKTLNFMNKRSLLRSNIFIRKAMPQSSAVVRLR